MAKPYIARISVPVEQFREQLETIPGAVLLREFAPGQVVVTLVSETDFVRLGGLPGVAAAAPDRLEHPDR
jgi:hypothetical protein